VSGVGLASLERASKELEEHNYLTHELVTQYSLNGRLRLFILLADPTDVPQQEPEPAGLPRWPTSSALATGSLDLHILLCSKTFQS